MGLCCDVRVMEGIIFVSDEITEIYEGGNIGGIVELVAGRWRSGCG